MGKIARGEGEGGGGEDGNSISNTFCFYLLQLLRGFSY